MSSIILIYIFHFIIILVLLPSLTLSNKFYYKLMKKKNFIYELRFLSLYHKIYVGYKQYQNVLD